MPSYLEVLIPDLALFCGVQMLSKSYLDQSLISMMTERDRNFIFRERGRTQETWILFSDLSQKCLHNLSLFTYFIKQFYGSKMQGNLSTRTHSILVKYYITVLIIVIYSTAISQLGYYNSVLMHIYYNKEVQNYIDTTQIIFNQEQTIPDNN